MALQNVGQPPFALAQVATQELGMIGTGIAAQEADRIGRAAGTRLQQQTVDLPRGVGLVEQRHVGNDESQEDKPCRRLEHHEHPPQRVRRGDVAQAQRQEGGTAHVEQAAEAHGARGRFETAT